MFEGPQAQRNLFEFVNDITFYSCLCQLYWYMFSGSRKQAVWLTVFKKSALHLLLYSFYKRWNHFIPPDDHKEELDISFLLLFSTKNGVDWGRCGHCSRHPRKDGVDRQEITWGPGLGPMLREPRRWKNGRQTEEGRSQSRKQGRNWETDQSSWSGTGIKKPKDHSNRLPVYQVKCPGNRIGKNSASVEKLHYWNE